jgi:hypothetical protein
MLGTVAGCSAYAGEGGTAANGTAARVYVARVLGVAGTAVTGIVATGVVARVTVAVLASVATVLVARTALVLARTAPAERTVARTVSAHYRVTRKARNVLAWLSYRRCCRCGR